MNKTNLSKSKTTNSVTLKSMEGEILAEKKNKKQHHKRETETEKDTISFLIKKQLMYMFCTLRKTQCRHQHPLPLIHSTVNQCLKKVQHTLIL